MSFLGKIFGSAVGSTVKGMAEGVGTLAKDLRSAITGEMPPEARAKLAELAAKGEQLAQQSQTEINKIEAQSSSLFVAGWRPFIGWVCGVALGWNFVLHPMIIWYMSIWKSDLDLPPVMDLTQLYPVVLGLLGLGAMRSYEKMQGVNRNH